MRLAKLSRLLARTQHARREGPSADSARSRATHRGSRPASASSHRRGSSRGVMSRVHVGRQRASRHPGRPRHPGNRRGREIWQSGSSRGASHRHESRRLGSLRRPGSRRDRRQGRGSPLANPPSPGNRRHRVSPQDRRNRRRPASRRNLVRPRQSRSHHHRRSRLSCGPPRRRTIGATSKSSAWRGALGNRASRLASWRGAWVNRASRLASWRGAWVNRASRLASWRGAWVNRASRHNDWRSAGLTVRRATVTGGAQG